MNYHEQIEKTTFEQIKNRCKPVTLDLEEINTCKHCGNITKDVDSPFCGKMCEFLAREDMR